MRVQSGLFADYKNHHTGWFRVFKFSKIVEIWFGRRWITIEWSKS